jgi:[acyl-carrier-protein] S-malonyltransferase
LHALVFPGQGVQRAGMGAELFARYPQMVAQADEVLGWSLVEVCGAEADARLNETRYTQPAIYFTLALEALARAEDAPRDYEVYAGHSLGEYNALAAAGVIGVLDGLRLVRDRALAMSRITGGGMIAVVGLPPQRVETVLRTAGIAQVYVANRNSDRQVAVAGETGPLGLAARVLKGAGAAQVLPLRVSGPFHTPLMAPAAREFERCLRESTFGAGHTPVVSSVTGEAFDPGHAVDLLTRQLAGPVEWVRAVQRMRAQGVTTFDEVGGATLTKLIRGIR